LRENGRVWDMRDGELVLTLSDNGDGFGEWSAIAVQQ
jgi:hypothetical protein